METRIKYKTAILAKEKGFNLQCDYFYTKINSIMYGIDDKYPYKIKNVSKKYITSVNTQL